MSLEPFLTLFLPPTHPPKKEELLFLKGIKMKNRQSHKRGRSVWHFKTWVTNKMDGLVFIYIRLGERANVLGYRFFLTSVSNPQECLEMHNIVCQDLSIPELGFILIEQSGRAAVGVREVGWEPWLPSTPNRGLFLKLKFFCLHKSDSGP